MAKNLHLKSARASLDISQQRLADMVGVTRQTISAIENGDYNPTINLCIAICRVLGKTLNELFWEEWQMTNNNYDERQKQMRHSIFTAMYFALIGYICLFSITGNFLSPFISFRDIIMTGVLLTTTLSIVLMIFKNCYLGRFDSKKLMAVCMLFFILLIVYNVKTLIEKGGIISNGKLNDNYFMFCFSFMWGIISISFFIKEILNRKKAKAETEE